MADDQILNSPSCPNSRGRRNMSKWQSWVGMGRSRNGSRFHGSLYLHKSLRLARSPPLEHGLTRVRNSRSRDLFDYGKPRQSRARKMRNKRGCRTRISAVSPLTGEAVLRKRCMRYVVPIQALSVKFCRPTNKGNGEEVIFVNARAWGVKMATTYVELRLVWPVLAPDRHKLFASCKLRVKQRLERVVEYLRHFARRRA